MYSQREHILNFLDFLYKEVSSAGGDGDAIWYTRFHKIEDLLEIVRSYNNSLKFPWVVSNTDTKISIVKDQEWIDITTDEQNFNESPDWVQIKVRW